MNAALFVGVIDQIELQPAGQRVTLRAVDIKDLPRKATPARIRVKTVVAQPELRIGQKVGGVATLSAPAPGAINVVPQQALSWTAVPWAASYVVEVSTDPSRRVYLEGDRQNDVLAAAFGEPELQCQPIARVGRAQRFFLLDDAGLGQPVGDKLEPRLVESRVLEPRVGAGGPHPVGELRFQFGEGPGVGRLCHGIRLARGPWGTIA